MKIKNLLFFATIIISFSACNSSANKTETAAAVETINSENIVTSGKYKIKSGIVHFENTMGPINGSHIIYFDDYGRKECVERFDNTGKLTEISISDGKNRYRVKDKTAWLVDKNGSLGWEMQFMPWKTVSTLNNKDKYQQLPNAKIADKDCESYSYKDVIFAGWNGITLLQEQESSVGKIVMRAQKIEENAEVPAEKFTVPQGYKIETSGL